MSRRRRRAALLERRSDRARRPTRRARAAARGRSCWAGSEALPGHQAQSRQPRRSAPRARPAPPAARATRRGRSGCRGRTARWLRALSRCRSTRSPSAKTVSSRLAEPSSSSRLAPSRQVASPDTVAGAFVMRFQANTGVDEAQHLLDRRRDQLGVVAQLRASARAARAAPAAPSPSSDVVVSCPANSWVWTRPAISSRRDRLVALEVDAREVAGEVVARLLEARLDEARCSSASRPTMFSAWSHLLGRRGRSPKLRQHAAERPTPSPAARPRPGTPSRWKITSAGSSNAEVGQPDRRAAFAGHPVDHARPSARGSRARAAAIRRGVNAFLMKPRRRVWSGGWIAPTGREAVRDAGLVEDARDLGRPRLVGRLRVLRRERGRVLEDRPDVVVARHDPVAELAR